LHGLYRYLPGGCHHPKTAGSTIDSITPDESPSIFFNRHAAIFSGFLPGKIRRQKRNDCDMKRLFSEASAVENPVSLQETVWDVIIVGAGPAGLIAAWYLATRGRRVLILEKKGVPREKICGEGLNHDAVRFLKNIGFFHDIRPQCHELSKAVLYSSRGCTLDIPGPFYTISRIRFDQILAKQASGAGAAFAGLHVTGVVKNDAELYSLCCKGLKRPLKSKFVILAVGAKTGLTRSLGIATERFPSALAARFYVRAPGMHSSLIASFHPQVLPGYGWIFPMGNRRYNIGVIGYYRKGRRKGPSVGLRLDAFCRNFALAKQLMSRGEVISPVRAAPLFSGLPRSIMPGRGNVLITGESIGSTYPLTGEGIGKAMESGMLAANIVQNALKNGDPEIARTFRKALDKNFGSKYKGYFTGETAMSVAMINHLLIRMTRSSKLLTEIVHDTVVRDLGLWRSSCRRILMPNFLNKGKIQ
jgi:geranylgeranyl reductase family protein